MCVCVCVCVLRFCSVAHSRVLVALLHWFPSCSPVRQHVVSYENIQTTMSFNKANRDWDVGDGIGVEFNKVHSDEVRLDFIKSSQACIVTYVYF